MTSIHRTQHLTRSRPPLRCHAWVRRHALSYHRLPKASDGEEPIGCDLIEDHESAERLLIACVAECDVVGLAANLDPKWRTGSLHNGPAEEVFSAEAETSVWVWSALDDQRGGIRLRGPEYRLHQGRVARIGDEIATPNARRKHERFLRLDALRRQDLDTPSGNQGCGAGIPKPDRWDSTFRYSRRRLLTASFHLQASPPSPRYFTQRE